MDKWIKISMDIFENRKIKMILRESDGYITFIIWIKLLCLAGKLADEGLVYVIREIPYSCRDLAYEIGVTEEELSSAMEHFIRLRMVVMTEEGIPRVKNFDEYQSIATLQAIRDYNRMTKCAERERRRLAALSDDVNDTSTTIKIREEKKREDNKREDEITSEGERYNSAASPKNTLTPMGKYKNVMISNDFYRDVKENHGALADEIIEELSAYMAVKGEEYDNHMAAVDLWISRRLTERERHAPLPKPEKEKPRYGNFDPDEAFRVAFARSIPNT